MKIPMTDVAAFHERNGITPAMRQHLGGVAILAGSIEFWMERLAWRLTGEQPKGKHPSTDTKSISFIRKMIEDAIPKLVNAAPVKASKEWPPPIEGMLLPADDFLLYKSLLQEWCEGAREAFECRNTIMHGVMLPFSDGSIGFLKQSRWEGELRAWKSTSFSADGNTLPLLEQAFLELLRAVTLLVGIAEGKVTPSEVFGEERRRALQKAKSIAGELNNLAQLSNYEKY